MTASPPTSSHGGPDGSRPACSPRLLCGCPWQSLLLTAAGVAIYTLPAYVTGPLGSTEAGAGLAFGASA